MDVRTLLIELAEKMSLLATAALVAVLVPRLRNRLLGVGGTPRDKLAALLLGMALSMWGAKLDLVWMGENLNARAIGIFLAGIFGGRKAGVLVGLVGGLFYEYRVEPGDAPWGVVASVIDGLLAGIIGKRHPTLFSGWRAFSTCCAIQGAHIVVVFIGLSITGEVASHVPAWPAHLVKVLANAAGVTLFVTVARIVMAREETAVALVEARAAADAAALEALRRRLEPHFLFNALNTLRATIRKDPRKARDLVSDLADLYRYLLHHPEDAPLRKEVDHACSFLAIEQARLGEGRLHVTADIAPDVERVLVPALLLQPLVENAVKHGIATHDAGGQVTLRAHHEEQTLVVEVENDNHGTRRGNSQKGSGIALKTLRRRLERRYGGRASLRLEPTSTGMRARVELPRAALDASTPGTLAGKNAA